MTSILRRNTLLLIELNAFDESTNKTASADWSLHIVRIACINDSHPASCPVQTCSDPPDCITSSLMCETITFPAMRCSTSLTPMGLSAGFQSIQKKASKDFDWFSTIHNFLITSAKVLHKSSVLSTKWFDVKILFQPSASSPDGPAPPLLLRAAFLTFYASIESNLIGWISSGLSGNMISGSASRLWGWFCFSFSSVFLFSGRTPIFILLVKSFIELWTLPFLISRVIFLEISLIDVVLLVVFIFFWIVPLSFYSSMNSPDTHNSSLHSKAPKWSFDFDFCESFCSSKHGITIIALNAISFSGESCSRSLINLETSLINFCPAFPDDNRNKFFLQNTTVS